MYLGVDVGGTKIEAVITTWDGEVLHRHRVPTRTGATGVVDAIDECVQALLSGTNSTFRDVLSVGIGVPGAIDNGVITYAVNLKVDHLDLAGALEQRWGMRPFVDNDVNVAAVGAWLIERMAQGSIAYLNVGTGLAAGLIINGALWRGTRGAAGEIGYVSIDPHGPADDDGLLGGLETYAGGCGIERQAAQASVTAMDVLLQADQVPDWAAIRDRLYVGIASAVRLLILTVDVDEVLIGGGLTGLGDQLMDGVHRVIREWSAQSPFLASLQLTERMRLLDPAVSYAPIGAAMLGAGRG